jgi:hypothetical protein
VQHKSAAPRYPTIFFLEGIMEKQAFNEWAEFGKKTLGLARDWSDIQLNLFNNLVKQQSEMAGIYLQGGVKELELLGGSKPNKDILADQSKLAEEVGKQVLSNVFITSEILSDSAKQMSELLEKSWEVARTSGQPAVAAR